MKFITKIILLITFFFHINCSVFKESKFDSNEPIGTLLLALRLANLADALFTPFEASLLLELKKTDGSPYANAFIKYGNEANETSSSFDKNLSSNASTTSLGPAGLGVFKVRGSGIYRFEIYETNVSPTPLASFRTRMYSTLTQEIFSPLSLSGDLTVTSLDISILRGKLARLRSFENLGVVNERVYAKIILFPNDSNRGEVYIASSSDGIIFDRFTQLIGDDVFEKFSSSGNPYRRIDISAPGFDGSNIVFFIRNSEREFDGMVETDLSVKSQYFVFSELNPPENISLTILPSPQGMFPNEISVSPRDYPMVYMDGLWLSFETIQDGSPFFRSFLRSLDGSKVVWLNDSGYANFCQEADIFPATKHFVYNVNGTNFLQCGQGFHVAPPALSTRVSVNSSGIPSFVNGQLNTTTSIVSSLKNLGNDIVAIRDGGSSNLIGIKMTAASLGDYGTSNTLNFTNITGLDYNYVIGSLPGDDFLFKTQITKGNSILLVKNPDNINGDGEGQVEVIRVNTDLTSASRAETLTISGFNLTRSNVNFNIINGGVVFSEAGTNINDSTYELYIVYKKLNGTIWDQIRFLKFR